MNQSQLPAEAEAREVLWGGVIVRGVRVAVVDFEQKVRGDLPACGDLGAPDIGRPLGGGIGGAAGVIEVHLPKTPSEPRAGGGFPASLDEPCQALEVTGIEGFKAAGDDLARWAEGTGSHGGTLPRLLAASVCRN